MDFFLFAMVLSVLLWFTASNYFLWYLHTFSCTVLHEQYYRNQNITFFILDCGKIICWGDNKYGQLTTPPEQSKYISDPYIIPTTLFDGKVTDIQSGWTHMIAITGNSNSSLARPALVWWKSGLISGIVSWGGQFNTILLLQFIWNLAW